MIDIKAKLIPDLLTLITQLFATGVLYYLYRRFLHEPVMKWLDKQGQDLQEAQTMAQDVKAQAQEQEKELEEERLTMLAEIDSYKEKMLAEVQAERDELIKQAKEESSDIVQKAREQNQREKEQMLQEVEEYVVDLASLMTKKVLENYKVDEKMMMLALEEEMSKVYEKH